MSKEYGSWSLADLKIELKRRNAKLTGKKAVLVQRLEDYDKLFGELVNEPESAFKIVVPQPEIFRDVNSDSAMPALTEDDLKAFCVLSERQNIEISQNMYEERFLTTCRSAYYDGDYYITAICASEMRKNVCYNVTIKSKNNLIIETQCECAAGVGPYSQCKHVIVVLIAIVNFNETKTIKLKISSTSTLQTFHQPTKIYSGNPIQAENLTMKFKDQKMKDMIKFDPRMMKENVEKYTEDFKSLVANYCGDGNKTLPISQILKPANKRAVFRDHDYLKKTAEEMFFDSLKLEENQIKDLETKTKENKKEWAKQRKLRLQSSAYGRICKQTSNKYKLAKTLIKNMDLQTAAIKHGKKYENIAFQQFKEFSQKKVTKCGIIVHPEYQFLGSTPDGLVGESETLEIKCPYTARNNKISGDTVPYLYLCEKSGKLKLMEDHDYYFQVQGQLLCTQRSTANFFVFTLCDTYNIKIERDDPYIEEMKNKLKLFYENHYKQILLDRFLYK